MAFETLARPNQTVYGANTHNIATAIRDHVPEWFGADYERRSAMNTKCSPCNVGDCYNNNILERVRPADM